MSTDGRGVRWIEGEEGAPLLTNLTDEELMERITAMAQGRARRVISVEMRERLLSGTWTQGDEEA